MDYGITRRTADCSEFFPISKEDFETILVSRDRFFNALQIEDVFDLLIENFVEFENDLLNLSMRRMLFHDWDWSTFRGDMALINRRLLNLLATARAYRDHTQRIISVTYGSQSDLLVRLAGSFSHQFDSSEGFRVMEALRNYSQHRGLLVFRLSYNNSLDTPRRLDSRSQCTCIPCLSLKTLREDRAFKTIVLDQLDPTADLLDIRPLVRQYISGFGSAHRQLREWMKDDVSRWRDALLSVQDRYQAECESQVLGLAAVERDFRGGTVRHVQVFRDFLFEYDRLVRKNLRMDRIELKYVSSAPIEPVRGRPTR